MTHTELRKLMMAHVASQRLSGLSRRRYCQEHQMSISKLSYWIKKTEEELHEPGFMAIEICSHMTMELCYPNGVRLTLPVGLPLEQVAACIHLY